MYLRNEDDDEDGKAAARNVGHWPQTEAAY